MYILDGIDHRTRGRNLVRRLLDEQDPSYGVGSMGVSLYDTAWLSMVSKSVDGQREWLFLDSFIYLLKAQDLDGGWHNGVSDSDNVLSTMAALLALCKHITRDQHLPLSSREDLYHRRNRAIYYLDESLTRLDVALPLPPGFEILVPKHLELLALEGIDFNFPGLEAIMNMRAQSAPACNPNFLYDEPRAALAEYLEGFMGDVDFTLMDRHKISGSIMSSPSATAAYLIQAPDWDDESEAYLKHLLTLERPEGAGGVPSTYPSTVFEITHVLSALLANGYRADSLGENDLNDCCNFLEACLSLEGGTTGSAPYMESDACNTAKVLSLLSHMGRKPNPQGLVIRFQTQDCFKLSTHERKPSFDANCHALKALLELAPVSSDLSPSIEKAIRFITNYWWTTNNEVLCSGNASANYTLMIMADALILLTRFWRKGLAPLSNDLAMRDKVNICLYDALFRTLKTQNSNGSWGANEACEETSYALLTLAKVAGLSSAPRVRAQVIQAIEQGRNFLIDQFSKPAPERLWAGKTMQRSQLVAEAYILAALEAPTTTSMSESVENCYDFPLAKIAIQTKYIARQAWLPHVPEWQIQACLVQSQLFQMQMRRLRFCFLPQDLIKDDQYFEMIPFIWVMSNNLHARNIAPEYLYQMMFLTMLGRQLDDYLQHHVAPAFVGSSFEVEDIIRQISESTSLSSKEQCYCETFNPISSRNSASTTATTKLEDIHAILLRFVTHVVNHPYVRMASDHDQQHLHGELSTFLMGRVHEFVQQLEPDLTWDESKRQNLVTGPSAHSYTLAFLCCLVGNQNPYHGSSELWNFYESSEQQYLAGAMCRHLSTIDALIVSAPSEALASPRRNLAGRAAHEFSWQTHRSHSSSVSSLSGSSVSSFGNGGVSPASVASSQSSAPGISPLSEHFKQPLHTQRTSSSTRSLQYVRLLTHERRCVDMCMQGLELAGMTARSSKITSLLLDASDFSAHVFKDPNIGSYCQDELSHAGTNGDAPFELEACPPVRGRRKGSVSRARAGLNPEPSKLEDIPCMPDTKITKQPKVDLTEIKSAPPHITEFPLDHPDPDFDSHVSTTPSIEMSRIVKIMSEMGEGSAAVKKPSLPPATAVLPTPNVNPMLKQTPKSRPRAVTAAKSIYSFAPDKSLEALKRFNSTPALSSLDTEAAKLAKARLQTQRRICDQLDRQLEKDRKLELKKADEEKRRQQASLQAQAKMQQIAPSITRISGVPPAKVRKAQVQKVRFQDEEEREKKRLEKLGWIKSPEAEKICVSFMDWDLDDGNTKKRKLRIRKGSGGPRLKLPF